MSLSLADTATSVHNVSGGDPCPGPSGGNRELSAVIALIRAARSKREELKAAPEALIEPAKREDGYVNYDLRQGA